MYFSLIVHPIYSSPKLGQTALHEASTKGNVSMVEFLMRNFNANLDAKDAVSPNTYAVSHS